MKDKIDKRIYQLICIFFSLSLLFPVTIFNKLIFFVIIAFSVINYKQYKLKTIAPFVVFFIFTYGFIYSFFNTVNRELALQFFLSVLVLFLIYPIIKYKIDINKIAKVCGLLMVAYTSISFLVVVVFVDFPISSLYYDFFSNYSAGSNGLREFVEDRTLSFHIGTVPFLYLPFCLYTISFVEKKKFSNLLAIILLFVIIFISASRGLILSCLMALVVIIFFKSNLKNKIIFVTLSIPVIVVLIFYLVTNTTVFDSGEESNSVKIGHYESFKDHLSFFNFFLGEGLASIYYSKGTQSLKAHTEITPLDMLRYFGFILTPILYLVIVFPTKKISSYIGCNFLYVVLFLIYVINSFTNPTMFNSYGLLLVLWYWYIVFREKIDGEKIKQVKST
jgi:hypothetical protein